jgi:Ca2+-binding RTX toxin-like protein
MSTINGSNHADLLVGTSTADTIHGGNGADILVGGEGDDSLDGGSGLDTAIYLRQLSSYQFTLLADGSIRARS